MNNEFTVKSHMIEVFRAMLTALDVKKKRSANIETIHRFVNPIYQHSVQDTALMMSKLIDTGYIRFRDYLEKRYYNASKLGTERWSAYLSATLHEITIEAEKRTSQREQETPPWDRAL